MARLYTGLAHHSINTDRVVVGELLELKTTGGQKLHVGFLAESLSGGETPPALALRAALESLQSDTSDLIPDLIYTAFAAAQIAVIQQAEHMSETLATALAMAVIVDNSHFYIATTGHCLLLHYRREDNRFVQLASDPWDEGQSRPDLLPSQPYIGSNDDSITRIADHAHAETFEPGDALLMLSRRFGHRTMDNQPLLRHDETLDAMTHGYGRHLAETLVQQVSEGYPEADFAAVTFQLADMAYTGGPWNDKLLRVAAVMILLAGLGVTVLAFQLTRSDESPVGDADITQGVQVAQNLSTAVTAESTTSTNPQEVTAINTVDASQTALPTPESTDTLIPTNTSVVVSPTTSENAIGTGFTSLHEETIPIQLNNIVRADVNETLLVNINHDPQNISNEATLLLAPKASMQLVSAANTSQGSLVEFAIGQESITFINTGGYDRARVALAGLPGLFVDVEGSCMKVEYIDSNTLRVACYDGNCVLRDSTDQMRSIPVGMESTFSAVTLEQEYRIFIYREHAEHDMALFETMQSENLNTCVSPYLSRVAPTAPLLPSATNTFSPVPNSPVPAPQQSQPQDEAPSSDTDNPEPTTVPVTDDTTPDEPTSEPTLEPTDAPTDEPEPTNAPTNEPEPTNEPPPDDDDDDNSGSGGGGNSGSDDDDDGGNSGSGSSGSDDDGLVDLTGIVDLLGLSN